MKQSANFFKARERYQARLLWARELRRFIAGACGIEHGREAYELMKLVDKEVRVYHEQLVGSHLPNKTKLYCRGCEGMVNAALNRVQGVYYCPRCGRAYHFRHGEWECWYDLNNQETLTGKTS